MSNNNHVLYAHRIGIDTYKQPIIFIRSDCGICGSEGFELPTRIHVSVENKYVVATLNIVEANLLPENTIGLSEYAWKLLNIKEGDVVKLSHPALLDSLSYVRSKIFNHPLDSEQMDAIIKDISNSLYSDVHISSFITACSGGKLDTKEITYLTQSMINVGDILTWPSKQIFDKHCVGGIPGNRTTMIVVPIVAAFGLTIPKTSSRAITSPSGTADTMEVLTKVSLNLDSIRKVVEKENGCIAWGGAVDLSPADDILIRVERALNLDNEGQLVASVLSKKVSAGSTHVVIDIPVGPTAKIRTIDAAKRIKNQFEKISKAIGLDVNIVLSDGNSPVGRGVGPALEARDVLAVLQNHKDAPQDLRERSLMLAGKVLECSSKVDIDAGYQIAKNLLDSGKAWEKFQAICQAQGGLFEPPVAKFKHVIEANKKGKVLSINNRRLATIAKLAGAPSSKAAGIELHAKVDSQVEKNQPLFTIHAESQGALNYAISAIRSEHDVMQLEY